VSPILVRPVREQFEHDRVIRLLQTRWRRRYEVGVNLSGEPPSPLRFGRRWLTPDLVLTSHDRARQLLGVVEVETSASINHLEAIAQWVMFAKVRAPFHLYVPLGTIDAVRRLCDAKGIFVEEIWSYHTIGTQVRFAIAHRDRTKTKKKRTKKKASKASSLRSKSKKKVSTRKNLKTGRKKVARSKSGKPTRKAAAAKKTTKSPKPRTAVAKKTARKATKLARSKSRKTSVKR